MIFMAILFTFGSIVTIHYVEKDLLFHGAKNYIFYSGTNSSQAKIVSATPQEAKQVKLRLANITGESAEYTSIDAVFQQAKRYQASFQFLEKCGEIVNIYLFSPKLYGAIALQNHLVNLHIAIRQNAVCVGSPIIFGGY